MCEAVQETELRPDKHGDDGAQELDRSDWDCTAEKADHESRGGEVDVLDSYVRARC